MELANESRRFDHSRADGRESDKKDDSKALEISTGRTVGVITNGGGEKPLWVADRP